MQSLRELVLCRAAEMCGEDAKGAECGPEGSIAGGGGIEGAGAEGDGTEDCEPYLSGRDNGNGGGTHGVGDSEGGARLSEPLLGRLQDPRTEQWQMDDVAAQETAEAYCIELEKVSTIKTSHANWRLSANPCVSIW